MSIPSLRSAASSSFSPIVFSSHTTPATSSSSSQPNSIFLSHHSSSSLQLQPTERSDWNKWGCYLVPCLFQWDCKLVKFCSSNKKSRFHLLGCFYWKPFANYCLKSPYSIRGCLVGEKVWVWVL